MHVRSFAPAHGIPEDPVCGSGNLSVAAYLTDGGRSVRRPLRRPPGHAAWPRRPRDGPAHRKRCSWIGGHAVTCVEGTLQDSTAGRQVGLAAVLEDLGAHAVAQAHRGVPVVALGRDRRAEGHRDRARGAGTRCRRAAPSARRAAPPAPPGCRPAPPPGRRRCETASGRCGAAACLRGTRSATTPLRAGRDQLVGVLGAASARRSARRTRAPRPFSRMRLTELSSSSRLATKA